MNLHKWTYAKTVVECDCIPEPLAEELSTPVSGKHSFMSYESIWTLKSTIAEMVCDRQLNIF